VTPRVVNKRHVKLGPVVVRGSYALLEVVAELSCSCRLAGAGEAGDGDEGHGWMVRRRSRGIVGWLEVDDADFGTDRESTSPRLFSALRAAFLRRHNTFIHHSPSITHQSAQSRSGTLPTRSPLCLALRACADSLRARAVTLSSPCSTLRPPRCIHCRLPRRPQRPLPPCPGSATRPWGAFPRRRRTR
jgi:hypothetical protein